MHLFYMPPPTLERRKRELRLSEADRAGMKLAVEQCGGMPTYLYAIGHGDLVKFGQARRPAIRVAQLQIGSPIELSLLGHAPGSTGLEEAIHRYVADHRIRGEWFQSAPPVKAIAMLIAARDTEGLLDFMGF